ncbi:MAG: hypothetical protein K2Z81_06740, partial [Cyanobacteria bacterium]|nr:hypothetical protein [Cyanobacteriota bacterium]
MPETDTLTPDLFVILVQRLLAAVSSCRWLLHSESFTLFADSDNRQPIPLTNLYQSFVRTGSPANLVDLQKQLRFLLAPPARADALSRLLPFMRSHMSLQRDNFRAASCESHDTEDELVIFPYADVLGVGLVLDIDETPRQMRYSDLDQLGLSAEDAIEIAVENLSRNSTEPFRLVQAGFYASSWKDSYDGARLLLTDKFSKLQVDGEVVAITPTPDTLLVTGSKDISGLHLMMSLSTTLIKEQNAVKALPMVLRDNLWTSFVVPPSDPLFDTV